jgi:hypothetical protein
MLSSCCLWQLGSGLNSFDRPAAAVVAGLAWELLWRTGWDC